VVVVTCMLWLVVVSVGQCVSVAGASHCFSSSLRSAGVFVLTWVSWQGAQGRRDAVSASC
jgi:threonine/homoserine/homoserine lactone efflux protein